MMVEATGMEPQYRISRTESKACMLRVGQTGPRQASIVSWGPGARKYRNEEPERAENLGDTHRPTHPDIPETR